MGTTTTQVCNSFKVESLSGAHCLLPTVTLACSGSNGAFQLTGFTSTAGICAGMAVSGGGGNIPANTLVCQTTSTAVVISNALTGNVSSATFSGDVFKVLLIRDTAVRQYDAAQTSVGTTFGSGTPSASQVGTDEVPTTDPVTGLPSGYTPGGSVITSLGPSLVGYEGAPSSGVGSGPALGQLGAIVNFAGTTSWGPNANFSAKSLIVYNTSARLAGVVNRTVAVQDFGGVVRVNNGTFIVSWPQAPFGDIGMF
jgi:hypothetical protein